MHMFCRLLESYTNEFESNHNFIFISFNQVQRHAASSAVNYSSKSSNTHMKRLAVLLKHDNFEKTFSVSLKNPEGEEAKELLNVMIILLRTT